MQTHLTVNIPWVSAVWMAHIGTEETPPAVRQILLGWQVERQILGPTPDVQNQKHREGTAFESDSPGETGAA